jgi:superfamily I DNA/RNA helicase
MKNPVVQAGLPVKTRESLEAFLLLLDQARARLHQAPPAPNPHALQQWAEGLLDATRYLEEVRRSEKDKEEAQNRVQNLCDLVASLDGESAPTSPLDRRLEAFLESITLDTEREAEQEATGDAVTLITMHSCKGLEFPHVFIVGLEDGLLPHSRSQQEGTLDEERRLFYVALTRAMRTLRLSYCTGRKRYGKLQPCHPSRFLKELPPDLLEHASDRARKPVPVAAGSRYFDVMRAAADEG